MDLEELAGHKGSAFGNIGLPPQPGQEQFENCLSIALHSCLQASAFTPIWLEDEVATAEDRGLHDSADSAISPQPWAAKLKTLLASHRDTVFLDHEFPPFPPKREVEFGI